MLFCALWIVRVSWTFTCECGSFKNKPAPFPLSTPCVVKATRPAFSLFVLAMTNFFSLLFSLCIRCVYYFVSLFLVTIDCLKRLVSDMTVTYSMWSGTLDHTHSVTLFSSAEQQTSTYVALASLSQSPAASSQEPQREVCISAKHSAPDICPENSRPACTVDHTVPSSLRVLCLLP